MSQQMFGFPSDLHWARYQERAQAAPFIIYADTGDLHSNMSELPTSSSGLTQILALASLISDAVQSVVEAYTSAGETLPPLSSTAPGPFDTPESMAAQPKLGRAVQILDAACAQLMWSVGSPGHVVANKCYGIQEPTCLLLATDAKIADHLLDKAQGLHVNELSTLTGIDAGKLARKKVKPNVFANNRLSVKLLSTDPVSCLVGQMTDEAGKACLALNDTLLDPQTTGSQTPEGSAFKRAFGCTIFEFYGLPERTKQAKRFNQCMAGFRDVTGNRMLSKVYPWSTVSPDTIVCDVGGGYGHRTIDLLKEFPHLKIVLQDLPGVIEEGKKNLAENQELETLLKKRVDHVPLDFFKETPVGGCDIYYLSHVLHDWPTAQCKQILDGIRKAVKPSSRLFVHEFVLQYASQIESGSDNTVQAPSPLLPNWGMGRVRQYNQDINMMVLVNGQERTLVEFVEMASACGFEFVKL
ncbi:S-adenosyl-L-methionine-dependent methyltransferase [Roridomyces roridus]|uniref:S-adenosyl-L-methionine-dependent methyltransferase n=1 Tax=Roridomyces roridus TaxID=1738132 RepID=A0AAD7BYT1_9AGAR|nr:S-adenosyl-L-methionine-dependent methyltransferase [Roridomyces roridus]